MQKNINPQDHSDWTFENMRNLLGSLLAHHINEHIPEGEQISNSTFVKDPRSGNTLQVTFTTRNCGKI